MVAWSSFLLAVTAAVVASAHPLQGRAADAGVVTNCYTKGQVALTFDDGPSANLDRLVGILDKEGVKATFFFNGQNYGNINDRKDSVKKAYNSGHQIASHTWSHAHLPTLTGDALKAEFSKTNDAIKAIIGQVPAYMRPPYGETNDDVLRVAQEYGQTAVNWSFDSGDTWGQASGESCKQQYDDLIKQKPDSILALNHETKDFTVDTVIPYAIPKLKAAGYKFVTVAQCLSGNPYQ